MANIGEVEFLIKFDSMNQSFKKVLEGALKEVDLGVSEDLTNKIEEIRTSLKILVTPYAGVRGADMIKAQQNIASYLSEEEIEKKVQAIYGSAKGLEHLGLGGLTPGTPETYIEAKTAVTDLMKDMADFTTLIMSSEGEYKKGFGKLENVEGWMTQAFSGRMPSVIGKIIGAIRPESAVVKKFYKELRDEFGKKSGKFEFFESERAWNKLVKDFGGGEKVLGTQQEFMDAFQDAFKGDVLKEIGQNIFKESAKPLSGIAETKWMEFLEKYKLKAGKIQLPRGLLQTGREKYGLAFDPTTSFRSDIKMILKDEEVVERVIENYTRNLSKTEKIELETRAKAAIEKYGWYFILGEAKSSGSQTKLIDDLARYVKSAASELITVALGGEGYSILKSAVTPKSEKELKEEFKAKIPEQLLEEINSGQKIIQDGIAYLKAQLPNYDEKTQKTIQDGLDEISSKKTTPSDG